MSEHEINALLRLERKVRNFLLAFRERKASSLGDYMRLLEGLEQLNLARGEPQHESIAS